MPKLTKVTIKRLKDMTYDDISKLSNAETKRYLNEARIFYRQRAQTLDKVADKVYSAAYDNIKEYYKKYGQAESADLLGPMAARKRELYRLVNFFKSKSSTVKGARQSASEVNKRIFGVTPKGRAKHRMTVDEQKKYWSFYNELINQNPNLTSIYDSTRIQEQLAESIIEDRAESKRRRKTEKVSSSSFEISPSRFSEVIAQLEQAKEAEEVQFNRTLTWRDEIDAQHSIYIGKGPHKT